MDEGCPRERRVSPRRVVEMTAIVAANGWIAASAEMSTVGRSETSAAPIRVLKYTHQTSRRERLLWIVEPPLSAGAHGTVPDPERTAKAL